MHNDVMSTYNDLKKIYDMLLNFESKKKVLNNNIEFHMKEIEALKVRGQLIAETKERYRKAVDNTYKKSLQEFENLLNSIVDVVFYDKNYSVKIDLSDKQNKQLSFWLYDEDKDLYTPLDKPGTGRGVKTVISSIIHIYYLMKFKANYAMLDESFINIDASYINTFFDVLKEFNKQDNFTIILITHDQRFFSYADNIITINDGVVISNE